MNKNVRSVVLHFLWLLITPFVFFACKPKPVDSVPELFHDVAMDPVEAEATTIEQARDVVRSKGLFSDNDEIFVGLVKYAKTGLSFHNRMRAISILSETGLSLEFDNWRTIVIDLFSTALAKGVVCDSFIECNDNLQGLGTLVASFPGNMRAAIDIIAPKIAKRPASIAKDILTYRLKIIEAMNLVCFPLAASLVQKDAHYVPPDFIAVANGLSKLKEADEFYKNNIAQALKKSAEEDASLRIYNQLVGFQVLASGVQRGDLKQDDLDKLAGVADSLVNSAAASAAEADGVKYYAEYLLTSDKAAFLATAKADIAKDVSAADKVAKAVVLFKLDLAKSPGLVAWFDLISYAKNLAKDKASDALVLADGLLNVAKDAWNSEVRGVMRAMNQDVDFVAKMLLNPQQMGSFELALAQKFPLFVSFNYQRKKILWLYSHLSETQIAWKSAVTQQEKDATQSPYEEAAQAYFEHRITLLCMMTDPVPASRLRNVTMPNVYQDSMIKGDWHLSDICYYTKPGGNYSTRDYTSHITDYFADKKIQEQWNAFYGSAVGAVMTVALPGVIGASEILAGVAVRAGVSATRALAGQAALTVLEQLAKKKALAISFRILASATTFTVVNTTATNLLNAGLGTPTEWWDSPTAFAKEVSANVGMFLLFPGAQKALGGTINIAKKFNLINSQWQKRFMLLMPVVSDTGVVVGMGTMKRINSFYTSYPQKDSFREKVRLAWNDLIYDFKTKSGGQNVASAFASALVFRLM